VLLDDGVHVLRRRRSGPQDRRRADRERKIQRVAEAVRKEQLRDAERPIGGTDPEDTLPQQLRRVDPVVLQMGRAHVTPGAGGRNVLSGTGTAPILIAPKKQYANAGPSSSSRRTRSSGRMPRFRSAEPARLTLRMRSSYVTRSSPHSIAILPPRPSATLRST